VVACCRKISEEVFALKLDISRSTASNIDTDLVSQNLFVKFYDIGGVQTLHVRLRKFYPVAHLNWYNFILLQCILTLYDL